MYCYLCLCFPLPLGFTFHATLKPTAVQRQAGKPFQGLGIRLASWLPFWCLFLLEHCPELQPLWQGHWQPRWPSATILFLSAAGQHPVSTWIALPHDPLPLPFLTTNWMFSWSSAVLPLLCSPPSTRWDPMDICNQPGQAQVHYTYRPTNPLYLSKFINSCNKKCRNGEIPGLANSMAQVSLRTYNFCSGHCYHVVYSFPNMGTAALNNQCWARVSNLRLPRASH